MQFNISVINDPKNKIKTINAIIGNEKISRPFSEELYSELLKLEEKFQEIETIDEANMIISLAKGMLSSGKKESEYEDIDEFVTYSKLKKEYYIKSNDKIFTSYPMPKVFADKVLETRDKGLSIDPLIKNFIRLMRNPRFSKSFVEKYLNYITAKYFDSKKYNEYLEAGYEDNVAQQMATFEDVSFTSSGLLSTYKYAKIVFTKHDSQTGDLKDLYPIEYDEVTGQKRYKLEELKIEDYTLIPPVMERSGDPIFVNGELKKSIVMGAIHTLDQKDHGTYQHNHMSKGLYVGGLRYINGYSGQNRILLNVLVDPAKICAFNESGQFSAIKTEEYYVHSAVDVPSKALYKESKYLDHTNSEWKKVATEAVEALEKKKVQLDSEIDQISSL